MKAKFSYAFLLMMITLSGWAQQNGRLSGKITDARSGAVNKASVYLLNTNYGAITDANGAFEIINIIPGNYTVQVSAIGYATINRNVAISNSGSQTLDV